jgi:hypothetical protein
MVLFTLIHPDEQRQIPIRHAVTKCSLFEDNPSLITSPYKIQRTVPVAVFRHFVSAIDGNSIEITDTNFTRLSQLSEEFGFSSPTTSGGRRITNSDSCA